MSSGFPPSETLHRFQWWVCCLRSLRLKHVTVYNCCCKHTLPPEKNTTTASRVVGSLGMVGLRTGLASLRRGVASAESEDEPTSCLRRKPSKPPLYNFGMQNNTIFCCLQMVGKQNNRTYSIEQNQLPCSMLSLLASPSEGTSGRGRGSPLSQTLDSGFLLHFDQNRVSDVIAAPCRVLDVQVPEGAVAATLGRKGRCHFRMFGEAGRYRGTLIFWFVLIYGTPDCSQDEMEIAWNQLIGRLFWPTHPEMPLPRTKTTRTCGLLLSALHFNKVNVKVNNGAHTWVVWMNFLVSEQNKTKKQNTERGNLESRHKITCSPAILKTNLDIYTPLLPALQIN